MAARHQAGGRDRRPLAVDALPHVVGVDEAEGEARDDAEHAQRDHRAVEVLVGASDGPKLAVGAEHRQDLRLETTLIGGAARVGLAARPVVVEVVTRKTPLVGDQLR